MLDYWDWQSHCVESRHQGPWSARSTLTPICVGQLVVCVCVCLGRASVSIAQGSVCTPSPHTHTPTHPFTCRPAQWTNTNGITVSLRHSLQHTNSHRESGRGREGGEGSRYSTSLRQDGQWRQLDSPQRGCFFSVARTFLSWRWTRQRVQYEPPLLVGADMRVFGMRPSVNPLTAPCYNRRPKCHACGRFYALLSSAHSTISAVALVRRVIAAPILENFI